MNIVEYQDTLDNYADYPTDLGPFYLILNTQAHLGKLSEKLKEVMDKDSLDIDTKDKTSLSITIGDLISNLTFMASSLGLSLQDILALNLRKLSLIKTQKIKEKTKAENS